MVSLKQTPHEAFKFKQPNKSEVHQKLASLFYRATIGYASGMEESSISGFRSKSSAPKEMRIVSDSDCRRKVREF